MFIIILILIIILLLLFANKKNIEGFYFMYYPWYYLWYYTPSNCIKTLFGNIICYPFNWIHPYYRKPNYRFIRSYRSWK